MFVDVNLLAKVAQILCVDLRGTENTYYT